MNTKATVNAICSIVSNNYFSQVLTLAKSIHRIYGNNVDFYIVIVDKISDVVNYDESNAHIIFADQLDIPDFNFYSLKYNVIEFNTFVKPFLLKNLLKQHEKVIYLDPDIEIFQTLSCVYDALDESDFVVSPHKLSIPEIPDENDMNIRRAGHFNLGFCGVRNSSKCYEILDHWIFDLMSNCYSNIAVHQFTDQKSISNLYFYYHEYIGVLNDPGINYAPWNFCERNLIRKDNIYYIEMRDESSSVCPLKFMHYSGFKVFGGDVYFTTKHKEMDLSSQNNLVELLKSYRQKMIDNHFEQYSTIPYAYNYFSNNKYISRFERRIYNYLVEENKLSKEDDSFSVYSNFYSILKRNKLLTKSSYQKYDLMTLNAIAQNGVSSKEKKVKSLLKMLKQLLGITNYIMLMKYMTHAARLENQMFLLKDDKKK